MISRLPKVVLENVLSYCDEISCYFLITCCSDFATLNLKVKNLTHPSVFQSFASRNHLCALCCNRSFELRSVLPCLRLCSTCSILYGQGAMKVFCLYYDVKNNTWYDEDDVKHPHRRVKVMMELAIGMLRPLLPPQYGIQAYVHDYAGDIYNMDNYLKHSLFKAVKCCHVAHEASLVLKRDSIRLFQKNHNFYDLARYAGSVNLFGFLMLVRHLDKFMEQTKEILQPFYTRNIIPKRLDLLTQYLFSYCQIEYANFTLETILGTHLHHPRSFFVSLFKACQRLEERLKE